MKRKLTIGLTATLLTIGFSIGGVTTVSVYAEETEELLGVTMYEEADQFEEVEDSDDFVLYQGNDKFPIKYYDGNYAGMQWQVYGERTSYKEGTDDFWKFMSEPSHFKLVISGEGDMSDISSNISGTIAMHSMTGVDVLSIEGNITSIAPKAFEGLNVRVVEMTDSVKCIKENAFYNSTVNEINLSKGLTEIKSSAFYNCKNLKSVSLPEGLKTLGDWVFEDCTCLTNVNLPSTLESYGYNVFYNCAVEELIFPQGITEFPNGVLVSNCDKLKKLTFKCDLSKGPAVIVEKCEALEEIVIGEGCKLLISNCFGEKLPNLKSVTIPKSVTNIGYGAFGTSKGYTVNGYAGSIAESFAKYNNFKFNSLGTADYKKTGSDSDCPSLKEVRYARSEAPCPGDLIISLDYIEGGSGLIGARIELISEDGKSHKYESKTDSPKQTGTVEVKCTIDAKDSLGKWYIKEIKLEDNAGNREYYVFNTDEQTGKTVANNTYMESPVFKVMSAADYKKMIEKEDPTFIFDDVAPGKWYSKPDGPIAYVVAKGTMSGTGDRKFDPEGDCTREMFVQIIYNMEGKPGAGPSNPFKDVKKSWYYDAVTWAVANGITKGTSADTFGIGVKVTREQLAQFLMNYAKKRGYDTSARADISKFPDSDKISGWAKEAISWANANGIINGKAKGGVNYLDPKGNATRAEVAQMMMNFQK